MFAGPGHPDGFTLWSFVFNAPQAIRRTDVPTVVTLALSRQGSLLDGCRVEAVSHLSYVKIEVEVCREPASDKGKGVSRDE